MDAVGILQRLHSFGVSVTLEGDQLAVRPGSKVPPELVPQIREHKAEIVSHLGRRVGDGQPPPLGRPIKTERELRRWMDHTADPVEFAKWLEWAMNYTDPAESLQGCP